jgi:hypothetical protein
LLGDLDVDPTEEYHVEINEDELDKLIELEQAYHRYLKMTQELKSIEREPLR